MNLDMLIQGVAADIIHNVQTTLPGEPGSEGEDFEAMLVKQSQAAKPQRKEQPAKDKTGGKQTEEPQKNSTKGQETTEKGQEVAAALVTSQPVVPFELVAAGTEKMTVGEVEGPNQDPALAGVFTLADGVPAQPEEVQPQTAQEVLPQEQAPVQEFAAQPQVEQAQPESVQPQVQEQSQQAAPEIPQAIQPVEAREQTEVFTQVRPQQEEAPRFEDEAEVTDTAVEVQPLFQRETAPPVKVGDPEPVYAEEPQAPQQLAAKINQALEQGDSMVQLQLNPENLGKVTVEIIRTAQGVLNVVFTPETARAAHLLQQHSGSLMNVLMGDGREVEVVVQQPQQPENSNQFLNPDGQNRQHHQQQQQQHRPKATTEDFLQQLRLGLVDAGTPVD